MNAFFRFFKIKSEAVIESSFQKERTFFILKKLINTKKTTNPFLPFQAYKGEFIGILTKSSLDVVNKPTFLNYPTIQITGHILLQNEKITLYLTINPILLLQHIIICYLMGLAAFFSFVFEFYQAGFIILSSLLISIIMHFIIFKINSFDSVYILRKSLKGKLL